MRGEAAGFGKIEIDRSRLQDQDLVGVGRVNARIATLGRGERGLVFAADGIEIREVYHARRIGRADAGTGEQGHVAALDVGRLDQRDGVGDFLEQARRNGQLQLRFGPLRAAAQPGLLSVVGLVGEGGDIGIRHEAEHAVRGVAIEPRMELVVLGGTAGRIVVDLGRAPAQLDELLALAGTQFEAIARIVAGGRGLAVAQVPVGAVVLRHPGLEARHLLVGLVVRAAAAQAQRIPQRGELIHGALVGAREGVVVDEGAAGFDTHVTGARFHRHQQQVAGEQRGRAGIAEVAQEDVVARGGRQAQVGPLAGVAAVAGAHHQRRIGNAVEHTDAAIRGGQFDAPALHARGRVGAEQAALGSEADQARAATADGADAQVTHRLLQMDVAAGGGGVELAAGKLHVDGLGGAADAGSGRQRHAVAGDQGRAAELADGAGTAAHRGVAVTVENGTVHEHVGVRTDRDRALIEADVLDRDRVVGLDTVGLHVALGDRAVVLGVVLGVGAQGPPVAFLPAASGGGHLLARDRLVGAVEIGVRVGAAGEDGRAEIFALGERVVRLADRADPVLVLDGGGLGGLDAEPAALRVAVFLLGDGASALGEAVAQAGDRIVVLAGARIAGVAGVVSGLHHRGAVGRDADDVGDVDLALRAAAGVEQVDHHGEAALVVDCDLTVAVEHSQATRAGVPVGIEYLAEDLDVAALDLHASQLEAVFLGVVTHRHLFARAPGGGAQADGRGATYREIFGTGDRPLGIREPLVIAACVGEAARHGACSAGHLDLGGGRNLHAPFDDAALHGAVDVEIARRQQHAAVGDDALAVLRVGAVDAVEGVDRRVARHEGERFAGNVAEGVAVALHEVAVAGHHVDRLGADRRILLEADAPRGALYLCQPARVADGAADHDVRRQHRHAGRRSR